MNETHSRSIAKALSWRVIATLTTASLVWYFTGNIELTLSVGALDLILKLLFYYLHERGWNEIKWGKSPRVSGAVSS